MAIVPIPTSRVSDALIRQRLQTQLQNDQLAILRLQDQLSSGQRILLPSEDAPAAARGMSIQRLLERKEQVRANIKANELYLSTADSALTATSNLLIDIRATALSVIGTASTDSQRAAVGIEIESAIRELVNTANQQIGGRYLFSGSMVDRIPYQLNNGMVTYIGDQKHIRSYGDIDLLFETNLTGDQVFGGYSAQVRGSTDLNPALTPNTRLADLRGGVGIGKGSIAISDGTHTSVIDLSRANTVADVVALIERNPPFGRSVRVDITATGLNIQIDSTGGGHLTIKEIGDGTTARDLGILRTGLVGTTPIVGTDLDPRVTLTTRLDNLLGSRAWAVVSPTGSKNDLIFTANRNGEVLNDVTINFVSGGLGTAGNETAVYDETTKTLTITIESSVTTANQVIAAVNAEGTFTAILDLHEVENNGSGTIQASVLDPAATGFTHGGSGVDFDRDSGLQVTNGGTTSVIDFSAALTVEDLLNALNGAGIGIVAQINELGQGIDIRSRVSGADFQIGENGGVTATQLGIRSFNTSTRLDQLNYGRGVHQTDGADFIIRRRDGIALEIDLQGAQTIGDVLNLINGHPQNQDPATRVVAALTAYGNGITLTNDDPAGTQTLQVQRATLSQAAEDLGFLPRAGNSVSATSTATVATATLDPPGANNGIVIAGLQPGTQLNGVVVSFVDTGLGAGNETVTYNPTAGTLVFDIAAGVTTASDIVQLLNTDPATSTVFSASLNPADGAPNDGTGVYGIVAVTAEFSGGSPDVLVGRDTNPLEVDGSFNALLRLSAALQANDELAMQRALELLDAATFQVNFARADSGARQQGLDTLQQRLDIEDTQLQQALSRDIDADLTRVVSELTARQTSFQAALQATAQTFRLSLLDYL